MDQKTKKRFARVKALYEKEVEEQKVVTRLDEIPISYEVISNEWLTAVICRDVPAARVIGHRLDLADEGTSSRRRIFLEYNDAGKKAELPPTIFCKSTQGLQSRFVLGLIDAVESETNFFNNIRPLIEIEAPVSLFANIDLDSLNAIVIMEDMAEQVEFCDHTTEVSLQRAESQMRLLANFHGAFYASPEMQQRTGSVQTLEQFFQKTETAYEASAARNKGIHAAKHVVPKGLYARADEIEAATVLAFMSHTNLPQTLLHNDVHLKNWYIAANGEMGLADWQVLVRGNGARDLAYTISTSLTVANRRTWETRLIESYLENLEEAGAPAVPFNDMLLLYQQQLFCALAFWTATLTPPPGSPEFMQSDETSLEFIKRITHAIDDHHALDKFNP